MLSSAANPVGLPALIFRTPPPMGAPIQPPVPAAPASPLGVDARLFERAKAALDSHRGSAQRSDVIGIVDFSLASREPRFHLVDLHAGRTESHLVAHGRGSDPGHSGWLEQFSNTPGSEATSNGSYVTSDTYYGKYGLSMKVRGLDPSNHNAESRAIVIHNAWYAEPEMVTAHGKLGRSQGCFAFSKASHWRVMSRLGGGRLIYADKLG